MAKNTQPKKYDLTRFWRYVFTPLLLICLVFCMFTIFSLSANQTESGPIWILPKVKSPPGPPSPVPTP